MTRLVIATLLLAATACKPIATTDWIPMSDGTRLAADLHLPDGAGPWPTILIRTPYGRGRGDHIPWELIPEGVAVVAQDRRGLGDSEGLDAVFVADGDGEQRDGYETHAWIVEQPWSDGRILTWGGSALSIAQVTNAQTDPPGWVGASILLGTNDFYKDAMYHDGVWRKSFVETWTDTLGSSHFHEEVVPAHPFDDDYWAPLHARDAGAQVDVPAIHLTGWYDVFQRGGIDTFRDWNTNGGPAAAGNQKLIVGPWEHGAVQSTDQGDLRYPIENIVPPVSFQQAERALLNETIGLELVDGPTWSEIPPVQYYVMGDVRALNPPGNEWRTADQWPPPEATELVYFLGAGGAVTRSCPFRGQRRFVHNPLDPVPTLCGPNLYGLRGPCDLTETDERSDVLIYETPKLAEPLEITGNVKVRTEVSIDGEDADIVARLTDVYPDGRSILVAIGAARLSARDRSDGLDPLVPGERVVVDVDLWNTSIILDEGHRLRVSITGSDANRYEVNRGHAVPWHEARELDPRSVNVSIHHDGKTALIINDADVPDCGQ